MYKKEPIDSKNDSSNQQQKQKISRRKVFLGWVKIFFVSGWMFMLGIMVGRGTAPVQFDINGLQQKLESLKLAAQQKIEHRFKIGAEITDKPDLAFYETLKSNQNNYQQTQLKPKVEKKFEKKTEEKSEVRVEVKTEKKTEEKQKVEKDQNKIKSSTEDNTSDEEDSDFNKKSKSKKDDQAKLKQENQIKSKKESKADKKSKKQPNQEQSCEKETKAEDKPSDNEKKLTIQVASLKDSKDADNYVAALKKKGFSAYKVKAEISKNAVWYRVRTGNFKTMAEASPILDKIKKIYSSAMITSR